MARIIMIGNQKGGVGKTMISHELCALFVRRGNKVLGIDVDGQRDFSRYSDISFAKKIPTIRDLLLKIKDIKTQSALGDEKKKIQTLKILKMNLMMMFIKAILLKISAANLNWNAIRSTVF